jgi:hypothetical protein
MLIIAGLGNPGAKYAGNRHNIGFMAVDEIVRRHGFSPWRKKFQAEVSEGLLGGESVLLMKPQTYMNESGRAVGEAMRFYNLGPEDIVVLYDELDLAHRQGAHQDRWWLWRSQRHQVNRCPLRQGLPAGAAWYRPSWLQGPGDGVCAGRLRQGGR